MIMLELHDIETGYGAGQVLFGVSLEVTAGACVSLMGAQWHGENHNGARHYGAIASDQRTH